LSRIILHHYDFSNYSEKVRLGLGCKGLTWHSVTIPAYAPKPLYEPLTAGYRRTPALQIGADVYCDTRLILAILEALQPEPTFYPHDQRTRALADALVHWAETALMRPVALYITGVHAERFNADFHADRARLHGKAQPSLERVKASAAKYRAQVEAQLPNLEKLVWGDAFVLGDYPTIADFALYEAPWFLRAIGGEAALPELCTMPGLLGWMRRVEGIGHGYWSALGPEDALAAARDAVPAPLAEFAGVDAPERISIGEEVIVTPFDQHSPAQGELVGLSADRITVAAQSPAIGTVHVHFPRIGYRLGRPRSPVR